MNNEPTIQDITPGKVCHKCPYDSFEEALKAMQLMNRIKGWDLKTSYVCKICHKWHNTSEGKSGRPCVQWKKNEAIKLRK